MVKRAQSQVLLLVDLDPVCLFPQVRSEDPLPHHLSKTVESRREISFPQMWRQPKLN